jgi:hypothetical protein
VLFNQDKCIAVVQVCYEIHIDNKEREFSGLLKVMTFFNLETGFIITQNQKDTIEINTKKIQLILHLSILQLQPI